MEVRLGRHAHPSAPTEPMLIPIVTTASSVDALELAQVYTRSFPAQENSIRDFLLSLGLDTNHGFAKVQVENSEVAKIRVVLERKLTKAQRVAEGARERMAKTQARSRKARQASQSSESQASSIGHHSPAAGGAAGEA